MGIDIWDWYYEKVEDLYDRDEEMLAEVMEEISGWAVDGHNEQIDAAIGPALARARELNESWVEVFLRHWYLQSLIAHRANVRKGAPEAASLIEFATRPENRECPQSVCAVQDFCIMFGQKEGHAYAPDRISIILDTMAEIEAERSCYSCLSLELCDAYLDIGEREKFEDFYFRSGKHQAVGMPLSDFSHHQFILGRLANDKGDIAQMRACAAKLVEEDDMESQIYARQLSATAELREGKPAEALVALGAWNDLMRNPGYLPKACALILSALETGAEGIDMPLWGSRLNEAIHLLATNGVSYDCIDLATRAAPLLAKVTGVDAAKALLEAVEPELAELKEPDRVKPRFDAVRDALGT